MNKLTAKNFNLVIYIFGGVVLIAAIVVSAYFVKRLDKESQELSKNNFLSTSVSKKIGILANVKDGFRVIQPEKEKIEDYLPKEKQAALMLADLETMSNENGLKFAVYQVSKAQKKSITKDSSGDMQIDKIGNYYLLPFEMTLRGSYVKIEEMIKSMENYERLIEVKNVKYVRDMSPDTQGSDQAEATLKINAYFKK